MVLGKVVGNIISTIKSPELDKYKLFLVEALYPKQSRSKTVFVAIDLIGAGIGDHVMVLEGSQVRHVVPDKTPADAAIIGIVESVNMN